MSHINYNSPIHVHFIGIGGISMSGLADILFQKVLQFQAQTLKNQN